MNDTLTKAVEALKNGAIIVYPTDTAYALGVDATNTEAIAKLFSFKQRLPEKALHIVVADIFMAETYAHITKQARRLADAFLPGPLTIVLKKKDTIATHPPFYIC